MADKKTSGFWRKVGNALGQVVGAIFAATTGAGGRQG